MRKKIPAQPPVPAYQQPPPNYARPYPTGNPGSSQYMPMRTLETSTDEILQQQRHVYNQQKTNALERLANQDYQRAKYSKAVVYRNERSYMKKIDNQYKQLDLFCDTDELRYFGLGTYFYIEFFRRVMWLFFVLTLINGASIYINFQGSGLSNYSISFSSYLIKTTLGNYSGSVLTAGYDIYAVAFAPALSFLGLLIFYWIWKVHFLRTISTQEQDNKDVKPQKFCVQIVGLPESYISQDQLQKFFTSFGPVYQVSLARNYDNKLSYFEEIDQLHEDIKEQELELALGGDLSNRKSIEQKKQKLQQLEKKLKELSIRPYTVSVFVHFQFEKSKLQCLNYFNDHYLFQNCCHSCARNLCCCCIKTPDSKVTFNNNVLLVSRAHPPPPEDINWISFEIGICNKILRVIFSFLIILIFLAISCTIIGLCSIYIETHSSDCDGIDTSTYTPTTIITANNTLIRCYCNAKIVASFTDATIKTACNDYLQDIYVQQAIQYAVIITSTVTNILFGLISDRLVNFIRPSSYSATLKYKTAILTLFFTLNSIFIPVLIYANIFGFAPASYVSFLTIISSGVRNFFKVDSLSFYPNFTPIWYRNVSPIFTNYILFNIIAVWGSFIFFKCCCSSKDSLKDQENQILQKTMNKKITDFTLEIQKEAASLYLIIIMTSIFWSGIPVLVPLAFLNILSRYIVNRSLLQTHSTRIAGLGEQFNSFTLVFIPMILVGFPPIAQWMLVASSYIYPYGLPMSFTPSFLIGYINQLDLQLYLPFYLGISVLVVAELVIYNFVAGFCINLCSMCYQARQVQYHPRPFTQYTKSLNILCSYNIRNNDGLRNAILNLQKYLIQYNPK